MNHTQTRRTWVGLAAAALVLPLGACSGGGGDARSAVKADLDDLAKKAGTTQIVSVQFLVNADGKLPSGVDANFVKGNDVVKYSTDKASKNPTPGQTGYYEGQKFDIAKVDAAAIVDKATAFAKDGCQAKETVRVLVNALHDGAQVVSLECGAATSSKGSYFVDGQPVASPGTDPAAETEKFLALLRARGYDAVSNVIIGRDGAMSYIATKPSFEKAIPLGTGNACVPGIAWGKQLGQGGGGVMAVCLPDNPLAPSSLPLAQVKPATVKKLADEAGDGKLMMTLMAPPGKSGAKPVWSAQVGAKGVSMRDMDGNPATI